MSCSSSQRREEVAQDLEQPPAPLPPDTAEYSPPCTVYRVMCTGTAAHTSVMCVYCIIGFLYFIYLHNATSVRKTRWRPGGGSDCVQLKVQ